MILMAVLWCSCFASGALVAATPLIIACKAAFLWYFFVLVRATLPRYRYDQLMEIGWKIFLLVAGAYFLYSCGTLVAYDALPVVNELATPGRSSAV
jgi:NADH:ubiquinone oxidoreductase subunit H